MSVPVVSGGQCGELYGLLESLNDLSAVGSPGMPSRYFNVTKMSCDTNTRLGEFKIRLELNESLYDKLIGYVPLEQWTELINNTTFGTLVTVRVTGAESTDRIKSRIDNWARTLFFMRLEDVVTMTLKVEPIVLFHHPHRCAISSSPGHRMGDSLAQLENRGDINEHWELTANGPADNDEDPDKDKDIESEEGTCIRRDCLECAYCDFTTGLFIVRKEWWHDKRFWDGAWFENFRIFYICNMLSLYAKLTPLHYFRMTDIETTEQDVFRLCMTLNKHKLFGLHLDNVNLDDDGAKHIMQFVMTNCKYGKIWSYLQTISLKGNTRISATVKQSFLEAWTPIFGRRTSRSGEPFRLIFD